jgi:MFS family permease
MITTRLPFLARPHAALELQAWAVLAIPNGLVAGAVAGVTVATLFAPTVPAWGLALAVGAVTGAGPLANVSSLAWSQWGRGLDKVRALLLLLGGFAAALGATALVPLSAAGLGMFVITVIAARVLWCGVVTLRAVLWRMNFDRNARTAFVGRTQIVVAMVMAGVGTGAGALLDFDHSAFRWIYLVAAAGALTGLVLFRRVRMRRQRQHLRSEQSREAGWNLSAIGQILTVDSDYRRYLSCLFVLGSGTLMSTAPMILILAEQMRVSPLAQVTITASIPMLMIPLTTPLWARLLARRHAIDYRVWNGMIFVAAAIAALAGATGGSLPLLGLAAVLQGAAAAGGMLGFSLAHNDFAPPERSADYLGLHVSLAGIRGLLAPLLGVGVYGWLESMRPGLGSWSLLAPLVLVTAGTLGFAYLQRHQSRRLSL